MRFPFNEPPNTAVITCCHIIDDGADILYVSHDDEDGAWQFLCGNTHYTNEARVASLDELFKLDNSMAELSSTPCDCIAERSNRYSDWSIHKRSL